jgi:hypothetical protein
MKRTRYKKAGTARMLELGYKPLQIWLGPDAHRQLKRQAAAAHTSATRYAQAALLAQLAQAKTKE